MSTPAAGPVAGTGLAAGPGGWPLRHLAGRFVGSLRPGGPRRAERDWARAWLRPGERALWDAMSGPDRRHAAAVARRVHAELGPRAGRAVLAAALLHDVGKADAGLRTPGRVVATVLAGLRGRDRIRAWSSRRGWPGRVGRYLDHDAAGAARLAQAGSDPLTVAWARDHHRPEAAWGVPVELGRALRRADDD